MLKKDKIKFEFVSIRFVTPSSFVYGSKEDEPEKCMAEKMNITFHVRKVACVDVCNRLKVLLTHRDVPQPWAPHSLPREGAATWYPRPFLSGCCSFPPTVLVPATQAHVSLHYRWE